MTTTISGQLRQIIDGCGMTRYQIAQRTGVSEAVLSRFMAGAAIRSDNVDRLAPLLGLQLVATKHKGK